MYGIIFLSLILVQFCVSSASGPRKAAAQLPGGEAMLRSHLVGCQNEFARRQRRADGVLPRELLSARSSSGLPRCEFVRTISDNIIYNIITILYYNTI